MKQTSQKVRLRQRKATHAARKLSGQIRFEKEFFSRIKDWRHKKYSQWLFRFLQEHKRAPTRREFSAAASDLEGFRLVPNHYA